MKFRSIGLALLLSQISLAWISPLAAQVVWIGGVSSDASDPNNWDTGFVPNSASVVEFRSGDNGTVNLAGDVTWNRIVFNSAGPTTINGTGTITLSTPGGEALFSGGGPALTSVINPNISSTALIQVNGDHSVTFNGNVNVSKVEGFATSVSTYNGDVTVTDEFISSHPTATIVFNGNYHQEKPSGIAGMGINNEGSDVTFTTLTSNDSLYPNGVDILNLYADGAGHTVRNGRDYTFIQTKPWSRKGTNFYSLNGFSDEIFFFGTEAAFSGNNPFPNPTVMAIDFGATPGANSLVWASSEFMEGSYPVSNFEIGTDSLQLGTFVDFTDDLLAKITINGIAYSATDPGNGSPYWNRDLDLFVQFFNLPDLEGDYNENGSVDAADYTIWRNNLGTNFDLPNRGQGITGPVSGDDYATWKSNFGNGNLGSGAVDGATVPEPSTLLMSVLAGMAAWAAVWGRSSKGFSR